jgi:cation:H+ antiporter
MLLDLVGLIISLVIILLSCELFTNGIEWLGKRLKMGDGVVGSIFSAVGTCLPETMIPIIAILFSEKSNNSVDIGIGAIVGAPFMLSTLAFFVTGFSVLIFWKKRKTGMTMKVDNKILSRDIGFFIVVYSIGISASFINSGVYKLFVAVFLVACYIFYIFLTVKNDRVNRNQLDTLYFVKIMKMRPGLLLILLQIASALGGIIFGAEMFVENMRRSSHYLGISALALSLILTPIATELPEKFNSVIWISKKKDTLALGNITGAMVFQSCIPVSIGILATSWELDIKVLVSAGLAILSAAFTFIWIKVRGKINPLPLIGGLGFYLVFILYLMSIGFK